MKCVERILFPADFSYCSNAAFPKAVAMAKCFGAEIHLLHASLVYDHDFSDLDKPHEEWELEVLDKPEASVNRLMDELIGDDELKCRKVQVRGITEYVSILDYARNHKMDLIIMGTHGRQGFKRWLLGSVAEEMVRLAPCPVISIKESWHQNVVDISKILVPIDFSNDSRQALHTASLLAEKTNARLQLLHVIPEPYQQNLYGWSTSQPTDFMNQTKTKVTEMLHKFLDEEQLNVSAEAVVLTGHPARSIVHFAETSGSGLIVMGHCGHSKLPETILGSVTEYVVRAATCPTFTENFAVNNPTNHSIGG